MILALSLLATGTVFADVSLSQYILNLSFESPAAPSNPGYTTNIVTDWTIGGSGSAGVWTPTIVTGTGLTPTDGSQMAYINDSTASDQDNPTWLQQTLSLPGGMVNGITYTLTYAIAIRTDINPNQPEFGVEICDGSNCVTTTGTAASLTPGIWSTYSVSYAATAADAGNDPTVYLLDYGTTSATPAFTQVDFDEAQTVPEPAGATLLGLQLGLVVLIGLGCLKPRNATK